MAEPSSTPALPSGRAAKAPFRDVVLVCGKCARKLDGEGFGERGRHPLRKALKRALKGGAWGRKVRVLETACLGLCPKRRQVAATPATLAAGRLLVLDPGADAAGALEMLLGRPEPLASVSEGR